MEIISALGNWKKKILLTPANALCEPCIDVSKIIVSVYPNFETLFTDAGEEREQSYSVTPEG